MTEVMRRVGRIMVKGVRYWVEVLTGRKVQLGLVSASRPAAATPSPGRKAASQYRVLVDDNYDYMDESRRWEQGRYDTLEEAIAACKAMVDDYLRDAHKPGMSAEELERSYKMFGDDPFIPGVDRETFSAWTYAAERAREMCRVQS